MSAVYISLTELKNIPGIRNNLKEQLELGRKIQSLGKGPRGAVNLATEIRDWIFETESIVEKRFNCQNQYVAELFKNTGRPKAIEEWGNPNKEKRKQLLPDELAHKLVFLDHLLMNVNRVGKEIADERKQKKQTTMKPKLKISKEKFLDKLRSRIEEGDSMVHSCQQSTLKRRQYDNWDQLNILFIENSFENVAVNAYLEGYKVAGKSYSLDLLGLLNEKIDALTFLEQSSEYIEEGFSAFKQSFEKKQVDIERVEKNGKDFGVNEAAKAKESMKSIFIVHGHDELAKTETARFIEKLGFSPIILHEQASAGKTIIEKIESYSDVGFGIVLYTPCDVGAVKGNDGAMQSRARQNVVFEHGYLIGRIGRDKVCALVKGKIETPNDISGVVYIDMDAARGWHSQIARELRNAGYSVDMNKI